MAQGPRFALSRWIILAMVAIAVAITTWAVSPISGNSAAPIPIVCPVEGHKINGNEMVLVGRRDRTQE